MSSTVTALYHATIFSFAGILVYTDGGHGASLSHVAMTLTSLKRAVFNIHEHFNPLPARFLVDTITPEELLRDNWTHSCSLIVMPGGRDLPYVARLRGAGNQRIKDFVHNGGSYLGLCAGGYYGSAAVEFAKGDPILEVTGPRELGFFPGIARGPVFPGFQYRSNSGGKACLVRLTPHALSLVRAMFPDETKSTGTWEPDRSVVARFYLNGGCSFVSPDTVTAAGKSTVDVLGEYQDLDGCDSLAAVVKCRVGRGMAVLSGVHFETSCSMLSTEYKNDAHVSKLLPELVPSEPYRELLFGSIVKYLLESTLFNLK